MIYMCYKVRRKATMGWKLWVKKGRRCCSGMTEQLDSVTSCRSYFHLWLFQSIQSILQIQSRWILIRLLKSHQHDLFLLALKIYLYLRRWYELACHSFSLRIPATNNWPASLRFPEHLCFEQTRSMLDAYAPEKHAYGWLFGKRYGEILQMMRDLVWNISILDRTLSGHNISCIQLQCRARRIYNR